MPAPAKQLIDSKENIDQMTEKSRSGPTTMIHNALGSHHHQTQPNIPEDDGIDEESSIISELKTPTSGMPQHNVNKNEYLTPSSNIISHQHRRNYQQATMQL